MLFGTVRTYDLLWEKRVRYPPLPWAGVESRHSTISLGMSIVGDTLEEVLLQNLCFLQTTPMHIGRRGMHVVLEQVICR